MFPPAAALRHGRAGQPHPQRGSDRVGDVVLHVEDVFEFAIEALRPEMAAIAGSDELSGDPEPAARPADTAFEDMCYPEHLPDPADVGILVLEGER